MYQQLKELSNHVIIGGFGRMSRAVVKELTETGTKMVIIDKNLDNVNEARSMGLIALHGDAANEALLLQAGVKLCRCLVTLIPRDAENLYVVMAARELVPDMYIVARAEDEVAEKRLAQAGANRVISPYRAGGQKIARAVLKPFVFELMELATQSNSGNLTIEEILIPRTSPMCGISLAESGIRKVANVIILSVVRANGEVRFNPSAEERFEAGSTLVTLGSKEDLASFEQYLFKNVEI